MIVRLILWACGIIIIPLMFWQLNNETKFKKNIALGVTLPYVGRTHPQTVELLNRFRRILRWVCLGLLVSAVVLVLLPMSTGLSLTVWLIWIDVAMVLPFIPYVKYHKKLKALKQEQGWYPEVPRTHVVNLTAAAQGEKPISPVQFLLPLVVSLAPLVWGIMQQDWLMTALFLTGPVCVLLFWALYQCGPCGGGRRRWTKMRASPRPSPASAGEPGGGAGCGAAGLWQGSTWPCGCPCPTRFGAWW